MADQSVADLEEQFTFMAIHGTELVISSATLV